MRAPFPYHLRSPQHATTGKEPKLRIAKMKLPVCGTERLVIEDMRLEAREVAIEDGGGAEATVTEHEWFVSVRPYKRDPCRCSRCGRKCPGYDRSPTRRWRTADVGDSRCWLEYAPMRVSCPEHGVVTEAVSWADPGARLTRIMDDRIAWAMCHLCRSAVRELMRVGDSTVTGACARWRAWSTRTRCSTASPP